MELQSNRVITIHKWSHRPMHKPQNFDKAENEKGLDFETYFKKDLSATATFSVIYLFNIEWVCSAD